MTIDENEHRSIIGMLGGGTLPIPPGSTIRREDLRAATHEAFSLWQRKHQKGAAGTCDDYENDNFGSPGSLDRWCYAEEHPPHNCIYCKPAPVSDSHAICSLRQGTAFEWSLCHSALAHVPGHEGYTPAHETYNERPGVLISYQEGEHDAEGSSAEFRTRYIDDDGDQRREAWRYFLRAPKLLYDSCTLAVDYCGVDPYGVPIPVATWVCLWYTRNEIGTAWKMHCNGPIAGPDTEGWEWPRPEDYPDQSQPRPMEPAINLSPLRPTLFVRFGVGSSGCFNFEDTYAFSDVCDDPQDVNAVWSCAGRDGDKADTVLALSNINLIMDGVGLTLDRIGQGGLYPHVDISTLSIKNHVWAAVEEHINQMAADGETNLQHSSGSRWDAASKSRWDGTVVFGDLPVTIPPAPSSGRAVTLFEPLLNLHLPAELTLTQLVINASIQSHAKLMGPANDIQVRRRIFSSVDLSLSIRPRRTQATDDAAAAANLTWLFPDDPYDIRLAQTAGATGQEHPHFKLLPTARDDVRIPYTMSWHALKAATPYSRGSHSYRGGTSAPVCPDTDGDTFQDWELCKLVQEIARTVVFAEVNNHAAAIDNPDEPQRYVGTVGFYIDFNANVGFAQCRCASPTS
jgi:hypothetical protein